jgi:hypothetical protein
MCPYGSGEHLPVQSVLMASSDFDRTGLGRGRWNQLRTLLPTCNRLQPMDLSHAPLRLPELFQ